MLKHPDSMLATMFHPDSNFNPAQIKEDGVHMNIIYDILYTNGSKIGHGGFLQIIPVLGGLQIWLTYQNLANNFAERSVEEKINFSPVKYPKEVRER